jgi:hypothetical protein
MRPSRRLGAVLAALLLGAALGGCSATTRGVDDNPGTATPGTPDAGDPSQQCGTRVWSHTIDCDACMQNSCCLELEACTAETPCSRRFECLEACDDNACRDACSQEDSGAALQMQELLDCAHKCDDSCSLPLICNTAFRAPSRRCGDCLNANCCDAYRICTTSSRCQDCMAGDLPGAECASDSYVETVNTCVRDSCAADCVP